MFNEAVFQLTPVWLTFFFVLGAILGSFANVAILRFQSNESVVTPASRCPKCQAPILWRDKIPLLSWFLLRGQCRACKAPISKRYVVVEFLTAVLFCATFAKVGWSWTLLELLIFFSGLVIVSFIDLDTFLLPDKYTLPGMVIGLAGAALSPDRSFLDSVLGLVFGGGFLWAVAYFYYVLRKEEGMGGGDIKLLGWIGAVLGWQSIAFTIIAASLVGSVIGLLAASRDNKGMKTVIPFGPSLAFGAVLYVLAGQNISELYNQFFFPYLSMTP
ncbi:MAG: prepilin peptidase [Bdellovibrio sp.]